MFEKLRERWYRHEADFTNIKAKIWGALERNLDALSNISIHEIHVYKIIDIAMSLFSYQNKTVQEQSQSLFDLLLFKSKTYN